LMPRKQRLHGVTSLGGRGKVYDKTGRLYRHRIPTRESNVLKHTCYA